MRSHLFQLLVDLFLDGVLHELLDAFVEVVNGTLRSGEWPLIIVVSLLHEIRNGSLVLRRPDSTLDPLLTRRCLDVSRLTTSCATENSIGAHRSVESCLRSRFELFDHLEVLEQVLLRDLG